MTIGRPSGSRSRTWVERGPVFRLCNIFTLPLRREPAHGGQGVVCAARIAAASELASPCAFIDYVEIPPGSSIGDHRHAPDEEEFYLVLSGDGLMRLEQDRFPVAAGDLIRNPPGGLHGLANTGSAPIRVFVFELTPCQK